MIKNKLGKCRDCNRTNYLIAERCQYCYWKHRARVKQKKGRVKSRNDELENWFKMQESQIPNNCENCGDDLGYWKRTKPRWTIAHILPKRENMFPEVATHPLNRLFLCLNCHQDFDNKGADIVKMKCFKIALNRLEKIKQNLNERQRARIPEYYLKEIER